MTGGFGDAKIDDFYLPLVGYQDILGIYISMNDIALMQMVKSLNKASN